jgi:hypothetical protein
MLSRYTVHSHNGPFGIYRHIGLHICSGDGLGALFFVSGPCSGAQA